MMFQKGTRPQPLPTLFTFPMTQELVSASCCPSGVLSEKYPYILIPA
jgi:hypothetical protein